MKIKEEGQEEKDVPVLKEEQEMMQSGHDIMFHEEVRLYLDCKQQFEKNKKKACEYIMSHCNTVMRAKLRKFLIIRNVSRMIH